MLGLQMLLLRLLVLKLCLLVCQLGQEYAPLLDKLCNHLVLLVNGQDSSSHSVLCPPCPVTRFQGCSLALLGSFEQAPCLLHTGCRPLVHGLLAVVSWRDDLRADASSAASGRWCG